LVKKTAPLTQKFNHAASPSAFTKPDNRSKLKKMAEIRLISRFLRFNNKIITVK